MADGVALPPSGVTAATDDAGAAGHVQLLKLAISADGSAVLIPADAANGLDVDVTRVQGAVAVTDNAGSLTVDAPVATPVFVRLSDGSAALSVTSSRLDINEFLANGNPAQATSTQGDGVAGAAIAAVGLHPHNGSTYDRWRNNIEGTVLASAARTATPTISNLTNYNARGIRLFLNITATPNNAETLTTAIEWVDPVSGAVKAMTAFPAITASTLGASPAAGVREFVYELYPGSVETSAVASHEVQGGSLPRTIHPKVTHSSTGSWTYSLGYGMVL